MLDKYYIPMGTRWWRCSRRVLGNLRKMGLLICNPCFKLTGIVT